MPEDAASQNSAAAGGAVPNRAGLDGAAVAPPARTRWGGRFLLLGVLLALGANLLWMSRNLDRLRALGPGKAAPLFALQTLGGETIRLRDLRGRVVLIDFWSITCPPCIRSLPHLNQVAARFARQPVSVLAVHVHGGQRWRGAVAREVARLGIRVPVLLDTPRGRVSNAYTVRMLPTTVLVGPEGRIRNVWRGATRTATLQEAIEELLPR